jgi:hypothetical protein
MEIDTGSCLGNGTWSRRAWDGGLVAGNCTSSTNGTRFTATVASAYHGPEG